jgi:hypothetical protein
VRTTFLSFNIDTQNITERRHKTHLKWSTTSNSLWAKAATAHKVIASLIFSAGHSSDRVSEKIKLQPYKSWNRWTAKQRPFLPSTGQ